MSGATEQGVRERREAIVTEHVAAENRHDVEATIATFHRPRYEVNGELHDGAAAVRALLGELTTAFSDLHGEEIRERRHSDDAVVIEVRVVGTHDGSFLGIPATGRPVDYPLLAIFEFEDDGLMCEKVYFDSATILRQIGVLPDA
jgi:steroid delta-isomerase-like uncharacterized protein